MKYKVISDRLEKYSPGYGRILWTEHHVAKLSNFIVPLENFGDQNITGENLVRFARIVAGKRDFDNQTESSQLFTDLAAHFGGSIPLKALKKADLLKSEFLELLLLYPTHANELVKAIIAAVNAKIPMACIQKMALFLHYSKESEKSGNPERMFKVLTEKFAVSSENYSEYLFVLSTLRTSGVEKNPTEIVLAINDIVALKEALLRIGNYVSGFPLAARAEQILRLPDIALFYKLLKTMPKESKAIEDLIDGLEKSTEPSCIGEIVDLFEEMNLAHPLPDIVALKAHESIMVLAGLKSLLSTTRGVKNALLNEKINDQWIKQISAAIVHNPQYASHLMLAIDYSLMTKKMDGARLDTILEKPPLAMTRALALEILDKPQECLVDSTTLKLIAQAGEEATGMAEFYVEFVKIKYQGNLLQLVAEYPMFAEATAKILKILIANQFHNHQPNIVHISGHLNDMPALLPAVELLIKEQKFTQTAFLALANHKGDFLKKAQEMVAPPKVATTVVVNPGRSKACVFNNKQTKEQLANKICSALTALVNSQTL